MNTPTKNAPYADDSMEIMLVEDEETDVKLILRALKKGGVVNAIQVVRDGQEALDYLFARGEYADRKDHPVPGLILLDLKLPKVGGLEVLEQVKRADELKRIPIVVLTSSADAKDVNRAYDLGANSYLVKPVKFSAFCEVAAKIKLYWLLLNERPDVEAQ